MCIYRWQILLFEKLEPREKKQNKMGKNVGNERSLRKRIAKLRLSISVDRVKAIPFSN